MLQPGTRHGGGSPPGADGCTPASLLGMAPAGSRRQRPGSKPPAPGPCCCSGSSVNYFTEAPSSAPWSLAAAAGCERCRSGSDTAVVAQMIAQAKLDVQEHTQLYPKSAPENIPNTVFTEYPFPPRCLPPAHGRKMILSVVTAIKLPQALPWGKIARYDPCSALVKAVPWAASHRALFSGDCHSSSDAHKAIALTLLLPGEPTPARPGVSWRQHRANVSSPGPSPHGLQKAELCCGPPGLWGRWAETLGPNGGAFPAPERVCAASGCWAQPGAGCSYRVNGEEAQTSPFLHTCSHARSTQRAASHGTATLASPLPTFPSLSPGGLCRQRGFPA